MAPPLKADEQMLLQVTESVSAIYKADNRDTRPGQVGTVANDHAGFLFNRTNLQASRGAFRLSLRLDGAWFFLSPSPADVADELVRIGAFPDASARRDFQRVKATEAGIELSNRYIDWIYPAKYTLSYVTRDIELSLGDANVQLGRGLVLSARKIDELASDTTVRGVHAIARLRTEDVRVKLTALAGAMNPLRFDESSGRYLGVHTSVTPGFLALTEAGMPRAIATDFVPEAERCAHFGTCSYAPDRIVAGGAELALGTITFGTQGSLLVRTDALSPDIVRSAQRIFTASQSVEVFRIGEHGTAYVEGAVQKLVHPSGTPDLAPGHAVYVAATWVEPRYSVLAEGKHYRRFFPLLANVSTARAREFSAVQYSTPPTTEEVWTDTELEGFNTCVTGGRLRPAVHFDRTRSVYAWLGHYRTYAESVANERCEVSAENENRVWDAAVGFDLGFAERKGRADLSVGTRFDDAGRALPTSAGATHVFYRELSVRYDVHAPVAREVGLELAGVHRRRRQTVGGPEEPWFEGQHTTGIEWGERLGVALGVEYDTRPGIPSQYLNGHVTFRPSDALVLGLFAGQRRGSLRCVGGVCRVYPSFEGARLDATLRF